MFESGEPSRVGGSGPAGSSRGSCGPEAEPFQPCEEKGAVDSERERFPDAVTGLGTVAHSCRGTGRQGRQGRCCGWAWLTVPGLRGLFTPGRARPWPVREVVRRGEAPTRAGAAVCPAPGSDARLREGDERALTGRASVRA